MERETFILPHFTDSGKIPAFLDVNQVLERNILRISTSRHEVDIAAAFILNRFELLSSQSGNTNPGIESIWEDERLRRQKMQDDQEVKKGFLKAEYFDF